MVVSTLKAARKRTGKIRSNLHTDQYAGSISLGHSQGQALVEPLAIPGVARHINKFLRKTTQKSGSGLTLHTSGLNCHWLKVVIALKVMIFLAFCNLSFCGCKTSLSGRVFIVALRKSVHNCCVPHQAQASVPGAQSQAIRPLPLLVRPTSSKVGDQCGSMAYWEWSWWLNALGWEAACIFSTGEAMDSQLVNNFATAASWAFKDFGTSLEGDCNTELIRTEEVSDTGNWEHFWPGGSVTLLCSK